MADVNGINSQLTILYMVYQKYSRVERANLSDVQSIRMSLGRG